MALGFKEALQLSLAVSLAPRLQHSLHSQVVSLVPQPNLRVDSVHQPKLSKVLAPVVVVLLELLHLEQKLLLKPC